MHLNNLKTSLYFIVHQLQLVLIFQLKTNKMYLYIFTVPTQSFQQTTRCRNINKLYYYSESKSNEPKYKSVDEVEHLYSEFIEISDKLNEVCKTINMDDEEVISQNDFFKLYCYNEYTNDMFKTNKTIHYENI
jgi:hypothetical protein